MVTWCEHFVKTMGNKQNRHIALTQLAHDGKEPLHFGQRQRSSRLVHDQHIRIQRERLGNLNHLLVRNG